MDYNVERLGFVIFVVTVVLGMLFSLQLSAAMVQTWIGAFL